MKEKSRTRRHPVLVAFSILYTFALLSWRLAFVTPLYASSWRLQLTEIFGSWFYWPLLPLGLLILLLRSRKAAWILLSPFLLFVVEYGSQYLPNTLNPLADSPAGISVRVFNWNSFYGNNQTAAFEAVMQELQPDIIALQEISPQMGREIAVVLADQFPYQEIYATGGPPGMAILSRYPFLSAVPPQMRNGCNCQEVILDIDGQPVTLLNIHPWPPRLRLQRSSSGLPRITHFSTENQDRIIDSLLDRIVTAQPPLLVLGDLNTSERQPNYARLRDHVEDAFATAGWGLGHTFPNPGRRDGLRLFPFIRIDYIFHDASWHAQRAWTGAIDGSDHRYVTADLILTGTTE